MTYVTRSDASRFLSKRLARIVPLYWIATLVSVAWNNLGFSNPIYVFPLWAKWAVSQPSLIATWVVEHSGSLLRAETGYALLRSLLFIPSTTQPLLGVGWTLNIELGFYLLFWVMLQVSRKWAPVLTCIVLMVLFYLNKTADCGLVCAVYGHDYVRFFVLGVLCFYVWKAVDPWVVFWKWRMTALALSVWVAWLALELCISVTSALQHIWLPPAVVFAGLILHSVGIRCVNRGVLAFGSASFALYLVHSDLIYTIRMAGEQIPWLDPGKPIGLVIAIGVSSAVAFAVHYGVERPLAQALTPKVGGTRQNLRNRGRWRRGGTGERHASGSGLLPGNTAPAAVLSFSSPTACIVARTPREKTSMDELLLTGKQPSRSSNEPAVDVSAS